MRLEIESSVSSPIAVENGTANSPDINNLLKQGVAAAQSGDRPLARTLLSSVTDADPTCVDAWLWLASISEYPEELIVFLKKVLDVDPNNERARTWEAATRSLLAKTHVQRGVIANEEGKRAFAIQSFDEAIAFDDRCESAWYWKASLTDDEDEKLGYLARVLEIDPEHADAKCSVDAIAQAHTSAKMHEAKKAAAAGDHETAKVLLDEIHLAEPENCEAWVLRAHVVETLDEKFSTYGRILDLDPSNAFAQYGHNFLDELAESVGHSFGSEFDGPTEEAVNWNTVQTVDEQPWISEAAPETVGEEYAGNLEPVEEVNEPAAEEIWATASEHHEEVVANDPENVESPVDELPMPVDVAEMEYSYEGESEITSFDSGDLSSGFAESPEPVSFVSDLTAREVDPYVSPIAETQEFQMEEFEFEDLSQHNELPDVVSNNNVSPVSHVLYESSVPSPWDTPVEAEERVSPVEEVEAPQPVFQPEPIAEHLTCPYCAALIEPQAFSCTDCNAVLSLSDIELLLANNSVDFEAVRRSVTVMEAEWNSREFSAEELKALGIGQFNLKNFEIGFAYIQEASRLEPNDVILAGQLNALAIRLDEIKRQDEINEAKPKGKTILVVDDSPTVRKLISSKLEKSGHQVICAVDGVEAMTTIETMVPDLVLLDIAMPRMDGYQVCKLIRANESAKDVPVVMISGKDGFFDKVRGRMAGTTGYITKPFGPETLMKALETYLIPETAVAE